MRMNSFILGLILSPLMVVGYLAFGYLKGEAQQPLPNVPLTLTDIRYVPTLTDKTISPIAFQYISRNGAAREEITLKQKIGKPLIVHFWAPWCPTCLEEMPSLDEFTQKYGQDVHIICVANDPSSGSSSLQYYQTGGFKDLDLYIDKQNTHDEGLLAKSMKVRSFPTTILISADGKEIGRIMGPVNWTGKPGRMLLDLLKPTRSV